MTIQRQNTYSTQCKFIARLIHAKGSNSNAALFTLLFIIGILQTFMTLHIEGLRISLIKLL